MSSPSLSLKKSPLPRLACVMVQAALVLSLSLSAALAQTTYTWNSSSGGNWNTTSATGWNTGGSYPTDAGDTAIFSRDLSSGLAVSMNVVGTVGNLTLSDTGGANPFSWTINGASALTFDSLAGPATLTVNGGTGVYNSSAMAISAPLVLNDALNINIQDMGTSLALSGALNANNNTIALVGTGAFTLGAGSITNLAGLTTGASQRYVTVTGNNTLTGNYVLNLRNLADFAQSGRLDITSGSVTINADNIGKATISGNITGATDLTINGTGGLNKAPANLNYFSSVIDKSLVRFSSTNTFSGNTTLNGAGLSLDFNTRNTNKIGGGVLTLNNALLSMTVNVAADSTQTVGSTTITPRSGNQVSIYRAGGNLPLAGNLILGTVTVGAESWTNFQNYTTGGNGSIAIGVSNANTNGILGPWATFGTPGFRGGNNLTWAAVSSGVVGAATLTSLAATGVSDATGNYLYEPTSVGATNRGVSTPITGNVTANSLKILTPNTNYYNTLSTGANVVTLTSGGLLLTSNGSNGGGSLLPYSLWSLLSNDNSTGGVALTGTGLITTSDPASTPLTIVTNRPTWIDNPLVGDSSGRLVKAGWGPLFLSAASTMEGITIVGGEVALTGSATLPSGNLSLNNGGALMASGTITRAVGTGSGQVSFGAGGGGFAGMGTGLTLNLTGSGAGGALTTGDVGNNLVLSNIHAATGVTTLTSNVDTTGNIIFSTTRVDGSPNSGTYSNAGSAYAVVTGATSGTGALTLLGPTTSNTIEANTAGGGLIYLRGTLGHTGGMQAVGTTVFLGQQNPTYLASINLNLSAGATLGASGTNAYTAGSGVGQISFASGASNGVDDAGGFSGVGGANTVTLNGGAVLDFTSPGSNPYQFGSINLGSTLSTHEVTLTNSLTATAQTVNIAVSGPQAARLTGNITGTANFSVLGNSFGTLVLASTGNTYSGNLTVSNGYLMKVGDTSAFGADVAKTITIGAYGNIDLAGYSVSANRTWSLGSGSSVTPVGNIFNSNTSVASTISGNITVGNSRSDTNFSVGGPGDITFEGWIRNNAATGSSLVFSGSGNYTFKGDFDNQSTTNTNTNIYGATIIFDNSVFNTDGVTNIRTLTTNTSSTMSLTSATFRLLGNATANTVQSVGNSGTKLTYAANTIEVRSGTGTGQVTTLNLGALTRGAAPTLNLIETNLGNGTAVLTTTTANGNGTILGGWVTYNSSTYAANDGSNNVIGLTDYNTTGFSSTTVTDITAATSTTTSGTSVAMRFNDTANRTLTINGTLARSTAPMGILVTDNVNGDTLITGGVMNASEIAVHQYETSGTLTIDSRLTGTSVQIEKTGPGTLVLGNGTNNGNAQAAIGQGVLEVAVANALGNSTASTNIILTGNATLRYTGSTDYQRGGGTGGEGRILLYGNGNIENNGTGKLIIASTQGLAIASYYNPNLGLGGSGDIDVAGVQLGGTAIYEGYSKITKTGTGTVTLTEESILQGGVDINAGVFAFSGNGSIQAWTPVNINGGTFDNKSANAKQGGNIDLNSGNITSTGGGAFTVQAINAAIASGTATVSADIQGQLASVTKTGAGTLVLSGNNSYWQGTMLNAGTLAATRASSLGDSTGALTFGGNATLRADASFSSTRNTTLATGVMATFDTNGNALSEAGVISGEGALTKTGSGTLTLTGDNTYTGTTTVSAGALTIEHSNALGSSAVGTTVSNGAALQLQGDLVVEEAITINGNGVSNDGALRHLSGNATASGAITLGSAARIASDSGSLTLSGVIGGNNNLTFSGCGTTILTNTNTYNGTTTISAGTLQLGNGGTTGSLSTEGSVENNGTLSSYRSNAVVQGTDFATEISGTGAVAQNGSNALTLSGNNTYSGGTLLNTGTLNVNSATALGTGSLAMANGTTLDNTSGSPVTLSTNNTQSWNGNFTFTGTHDLELGTGAVTLGASVALHTAAGNLTVGGGISGAGYGLTKTGTGTLVLAGASSYTGATTINAGTLALTGSTTNSATSINTGGTLLGTGSAGGVTVNTGGLIAPGAAANTVGTLATSTLTLNGGGGYTWDLANVNGSPGTEWDLLTVGAGAGAVTINATPASKFTIYLTGNPTGWDPAVSHASGWDIIEWGSVTGFDASAFALNASNFSGATPTGTWAFSNAGGYLNLAYMAPSTSAVWIAGSGDWATAANWQSGSVPSNLDPIEFVGAGGTSTNNGTLTSVNGITFTADASGSYSVNGTALQIGGIGVVNASSYDQTVSNNLTMTAVQTFDSGTANLTIAGTVANGGYLLTTAGDETLTLSGAVSGVSGITKTGAGQLVMSGANSYTGATTISSGTLLLNGAGVLGAGNYSATISNGGELILNTSADQILSGAITGTGSLEKNSTGALTLSGNNTYSGGTTLTAGTLRLNASTALGTGALTITGGSLDNTSGGAVTLSTNNAQAWDADFTFTGTNDLALGTGNVTLGATRTLTVNAGNLTVSGAISGEGYGLTKVGAGTLVLDGTNSFNGGVLISAGTLAVGGGSALIDSGTVTLANVAGATLLVTASETIGSLQGGGTSGGGVSIAAGQALTVVETGNQTFSGFVNGGGRFVKSGAGTLLLAGNTTCTGGTSVEAGTLQVGDGADTGTLDTDNVTNNGTLVFNSTANSTIGGIVSGTGNLNKLGAGTLILAANNTYTGATTIASGTLQVGNGSATGSLSTSSSLTNNGTLLFNRSALLIQGTDFADVISGTGTVVNAGPGDLVLTGNNTYTGGTRLLSGTLSVSADQNLGATLGAITLDGGAITFTSAFTVNRSITLGTNGGKIDTHLLSSTTPITFSGDVSGNGPLTFAANGDLTVTTSGYTRLSGNNSYTGTITITGGLVLPGSSTAFGDASNMVVLNGGGLLNNFANLTVSNPLTLGAAGGTIRTWTAASVNINATISGTGKLDLTDGGVVNLLGANTFTGDTRIQNQGLGRVTLNLANVDALAGSTLDMNSLDTGLLYFTVAGNNTYNLGGLKGTRYITSLDGNSLSIGANDQSTTYSGIITATGGLTKVGNGTLTLSGNNSYTGTTAIDSGTLAISGGLAIVNTGTVSLANAAGVGLNVTASETIGSLQGGGATGGTVTIDAAQTLTVAETGSATFSGVITGAGGLTKTDAGTLTLSGNNDFTGATSISGGILNLSNVSALATTSGITLSGSSGLTFSGASDTFTRSVTVSPAETGFLRNSGGGVITLSGALSKNGSVLRFAEGSFTITGGITGSNADSDVYYESGGVISLNATNTYNGPTYILNGTTVNANVAGALPTDSLTALTINGPSSTLVLGAHQSIASLAGDADATVALGSYTLTVNGSTATAFAGTISGTGSLAKAGSGNLTLSAATTFTGATTIDSGKVVAATANALGGTSSITVNNGGSLLVTANGSVNDAATITLAGGAVSFSGNISETFGALTLSANSSLDLGTESVVAIFASIAGLNTYTLSIYNWTGNTLWSGHPGGGQDQVYIGSSLSPSDLQQISFYSGTDPNSFIANAWQLATYEVIAVPEPSSLLTAGLLVSLLGWMNKKPLARILRRKISSSPSLA